jgi:putative tryptophan/tyrosine transport system substrate-binding protein
MKRREFLALLGGAALVDPHAALAQTPGRIYHLGTIQPAIPLTDASLFGKVLVRALGERGYILGQNLTFDARGAMGDVAKLPSLLQELKARDVDVVVGVGYVAALAAKAAGIPTVIAWGAGDPVETKLIDSLAHPGGNITGLSHASPEVSGKRLQLLKQLAPKTVRVAVLGNAASTIDVLAFRETQAAAAALGLELQKVDARTPDDHAAAFATVTASGVDAMHVVGNPANFKNRQAIADFALRSRLPSCYEERDFALVGGLISYAASYPDLYFRAATYVDKILKGAKPGELPIQHPTKFELVINLKTATALGLTIPPPLLLQADEVIR